MDGQRNDDKQQVTNKYRNVYIILYVYVAYDGLPTIDVVSFGCQFVARQLV
jgi:hypothetical protein